MVRFGIRSAVLILVLTSGFAQRPRQPGESWERLFNGTDLNGWVKVGPEKWEVENGVIHGQGTSDAYGYLSRESSASMTVIRSPY